MRQFFKSCIFISVLLFVPVLLFVLTGREVFAAPGDTIETGIFADEIDLSGMSYDEACSTIRNMTKTRGTAQITLTESVEPM